MKRDSGRIEGLYYDPGSQPYQRLDLVPEGSRGCAAAWGGVGVSGRDDAEEKGLNMVGGVRKWFPSVDFGR
jgi:hypothetical protein